MQIFFYGEDLSDNDQTPKLNNELKFKSTIYLIDQKQQAKCHVCSIDDFSIFISTIVNNCVTRFITLLFVQTRI